MILWRVRSQQTLRGVSWPKSLRIKRIENMCHRAARIFKSPTHKMAIYFLSLQSLSLTVCTSSSEHFQPSPIQVQAGVLSAGYASLFYNIHLHFQILFASFQIFFPARSPHLGWLAGDVFQQEANGWTHFLIILRPRISAIHQQINWPNFPPQLTLHTAHRRSWALCQPLSTVNKLHW